MHVVAVDTRQILAVIMIYGRGNKAAFAIDSKYI